MGGGCVRTEASAKGLLDARPPAPEVASPLEEEPPGTAPSVCWKPPRSAPHPRLRTLRGAGGRQHPSAAETTQSQPNYS